MKLARILLEEKVDLTPLGKLDDLIAAEIEAEVEKASKENPNEGVMTVAIILAAVPGVLKIMDKVGRALFTAAGINLSKRTPSDVQKAYNVIIATADKIDSYMDGPFRIILKPFINDTNKRNKVAGALKAAVLTILSIGSSIDPTAVKEIGSLITSASPEVGKDLAWAAADKNGVQVAKIIRGYIGTLIKSIK